MFTLPELPYNMNALEPYISKNTVEFHYLKHHRGYLDKLNKLIAGTEFENKKLEEIILLTHGQSAYADIYNNAAQFWNHNIYWRSLKADGGAPRDKSITDRLAKSFGSYDDFCEILLRKALAQFGSGWVWLAEDKQNNLLVYATANADNPLIYGHKALLTVDVWEHGYYLDYQNRREDYLRNVINNLLNWENFAANL